MRRRGGPSQQNGVPPGVLTWMKQDVPSNAKRVLVAVSQDSAGIARLLPVLHNANCRVTVVAPAGLELLSSKHYDQYAVTRNGAQGVVNALTSGELDRAEFNFAIIADRQVLELLMSPSTPEEAKAWLPMSGSSIAGWSLPSASNFFSNAKQHNMPVPEFQFARGPHQALKAAQELGFPLRLRLARNHAPQSAGIIENSVMLRAVTRTIPPAATALMQHYVSGARVRTTALMQNGFPLAWFSWKNPVDRNRGKSSRFSGTVYDHVDVEPVLHRLGKWMGFTGFCGVNWILEQETRRLYLVGFQPYPTESVHAGRRAGIDFASVLAQTMANTATVLRPRPRQEVTNLAIFPEAAIEAVQERSVTLLLQSLRDAPFGDPRLLAAQFRRLVSACLRPAVAVLKGPSKTRLGVEHSSKLGTQPASLQ